MMMRTRSRLATSSLVLALLSAAPAAADPPRAISLRVTGDGIAPAALAPRVAAELGREVVDVASDGACDAPCLDVAIDGGRAIVRFSAADGAPPRARTIELGSDRSAWPTLVTLLAGNLARDQTGDVLALLPAPPKSDDVEPVGSPAELPDALIAPPAPPAPPAPSTAPPQSADAPAPIYGASSHETPAADDDSTFVIGLVPGLSTDFTHLRARHDLALHLAVGVGGGLDGISLAGAVDVETGPIDGVQLSGAVNVGAAIDGIQIAGAVNVGRSLDGFQAAGAVNVGGGESDGAQIAGAVNVARDTDGFQVAGAVNVARDLDGTQVAGAVNVARDVDGFQIGVVNVARRVDGFQLGVINIGGSGDGASIGLIGLVPGGRTDIEASVDARSLGTILLRHGSARWHNVYGVGGQRAEDVGTHARDDLWMAGLGLGPTWRAGAATIDLDAMCWHVSTTGHFDDGVSLLNQLRLSVALAVGPVALVGGAELNVYVGEHTSAPYMLLTTAPMPTTSTPADGGVGVTVWPSLFVGVRL